VAVAVQVPDLQEMYQIVIERRVHTHDTTRVCIHTRNSLLVCNMVCSLLYVTKRLPFYEGPLIPIDSDYPTPRKLYKKKTDCTQCVENPGPGKSHFCFKCLSDFEAIFSSNLTVI
jgi:hypothetical protein